MQLLPYYATCFVGKVCSHTWSTWGASPGEGKSGAEVGIVNRKVVRQARAGQTFPPWSSTRWVGVGGGRVQQMARGRVPTHLTPNAGGIISFLLRESVTVARLLTSAASAPGCPSHAGASVVDFTGDATVLQSLHGYQSTPPPSCPSPPQGRRSPITSWGTVAK